jgi:tetratricopeptide (TPR) repeat protein
MQLTKDQITTLTAGIVSTEVMEEKWNGETYWLRARIRADDKDVANSIERLRNDRQKIRELEESRRQAREAMDEVERLRAELAAIKAKGDTDKQTQYNIAVDKLSATDWFERAGSYYDAAEYQKALNALNMAIKLNPEYAQAYGAAGEVYFEIGNYEKVIENLDKFVKIEQAKIDPNLDDEYLLMGKAYYKLGNYKRTLEYIERAYNCNADIRFYEFEFEEFNNLISIFPEDYRAYISRGIYYLGADILEGDIYINSIKKALNAISDFNKALEIKPEHAITNFLLGIASSSINEILAIEYFSRAIELKLNITRNNNVYHERAKAYLDLKEYQQAINDFDRAIEIDPTNNFIFADRGEANYKLKRYQKALNDFDAAIEHALSIPHYEDFLKDRLLGLYFKRGNIHYKLGNYQKAVSNFNEIVEADPQYKFLGLFFYSDDGSDDGYNISVYRKRGESHYKLKNYQLAFSDFDKWIELRPDYAYSYFIRGTAYYELKDYKMAIRDYDRYIELKPNNAIIYTWRGISYYKSGNDIKACSDFTKACELGECQWALKYECK